MAKLKSHKGLKKVLKIRKGGTITFRASGCNHNTGKRPAKRNNRNAADIKLDKSDRNRLKNLLNS